jgi:hypothetical protein
VKKYETTGKVSKEEFTDIFVRELIRNRPFFKWMREDLFKDKQDTLDRIQHAFPAQDYLDVSKPESDQEELEKHEVESIKYPTDSNFVRDIKIFVNEIGFMLQEIGLALKDIKETFFGRSVLKDLDLTLPEDFQAVQLRNTDIETVTLDEFKHAMEIDLPDVENTAWERRQELAGAVLIRGNIRGGLTPYEECAQIILIRDKEITFYKVCLRAQEFGFSKEEKLQEPAKDGFPKPPDEKGQKGVDGGSVELH